MFNLALLLTLLFSCQKKEVKDKKELNILLSSDVSTLDTAISYDTVSSKVIAQINETLFEYDYLARPYKLAPLLAESLPDISENGLVYKIKIKNNIQYHHNSFFKYDRFLKSEDFINQIKRIALKSTNSPGWWLFDQKIKGLNDFREKAKNDLSNFFKLQVEGLQAPDDQTLIITLNRKSPQFIYSLAMSFTSPIPKEFLLKNYEKLHQGIIGTGPFKIVNWTKGSKIQIMKFENYHEQYYPSIGDRYAHANNLLKDSGKRIPFLDVINFNIIREAQPAWFNFLSRKIDMLVLSKEHFPLALDTQGSIKKELLEQNIKIQIESTLTYWWIAFNMKDPVLGKNLNLRKAIAHAINIDDYIEKFTNNMALKANSIFPPSINGYDPNKKLPYNYDLKKARIFLEKAGYKNGAGLPRLKYDVRGNNTVSRQMGEFIQKELYKIGINVDVIINPFTQFLRKAQNGDLQFWQGGWALDYPDPENVVQLLYSKNHSPGPNSSFYSNSIVDNLYEQIAKSSDEKESLQLTKKVELIVNKEIPWIMQYYSRNYILYDSKIENFRQSDLIHNNFKYINIKE